MSMRRCASKSRASSTERSVNSRRCRSSLCATSASTFFMISSSEVATGRATAGAGVLRIDAISDFSRCSSCESSVAQRRVHRRGDGGLVGGHLRSRNRTPRQTHGKPDAEDQQGGSRLRPGRERRAPPGCACSGTCIWNPSSGTGGVHTARRWRVQPRPSTSFEHDVASSQMGRNDITQLLLAFLVQICDQRVLISTLECLVHVRFTSSRTPCPRRSSCLRNCDSP